MTSLSDVTAPKSDQLNADDLIGGRTLTIRINKITIKPGDQPVAVHFDGDNGKPYKPCKSMCRLMMWVWGPDASKYVGRSLTLYRDDNVEFGGLKVGGIRISHASDIDRSITVNLTKTRARKQPYTVEPLTRSAAPLPADMASAVDPAPPAAAEADSTEVLMEWDGKLAEAAKMGMAALKDAWEAVPRHLKPDLVSARDRRHKPTADAADNGMAPA